MKAIEQIQGKIILANQMAELNRGRGVNIGMFSPNTIEVSIRTNKGRAVFALVEKPDAVKLIHQIAAALGCKATIEKTDTLFEHFNPTAER